MALNSYALTTVARLKAFLGISVDDYNAILERIINISSDLIEHYCCQRFKETAYTQEIYDGSGGTSLILNNAPVNSSETFTLEQRDSIQNINSFSAIDSDLYYVDYVAGIIKFVGSNFTSYPRNYRVTYTAGYAFDNTTPGATLESVGLGDLEYAVWKLCGKAFKNRQNAGGFIQSETIGKYSLTYGGLNSAMMVADAEIKGILDSYRRVFNY